MLCSAWIRTPGPQDGRCRRIHLTMELKHPPHLISTLLYHMSLLYTFCFTILNSSFVIHFLCLFVLAFIIFIIVIISVDLFIIMLMSPDEIAFIINIHPPDNIDGEIKELFNRYSRLFKDTHTSFKKKLWGSVGDVEWWWPSGQRARPFYSENLS